METRGRFQLEAGGQFDANTQSALRLVKKAVGSLLFCHNLIFDFVIGCLRKDPYLVMRWP